MRGEEEERAAIPPFLGQREGGGEEKRPEAEQLEGEARGTALAAMRRCI